VGQHHAPYLIQIMQNENFRISSADCVGENNGILENGPIMSGHSDWTCPCERNQEEKLLGILFLGAKVFLNGVFRQKQMRWLFEGLISISSAKFTCGPKWKNQ